MLWRSCAWPAAVVLAGFISGARAEEKATASGTWKWEFKRQNGDAVEVTLKLTQDGERLTGTISGPGGIESAIQDGSVKGGTVSFQVTSERNGGPFTRKYQGKLSGDTIKGKVEMEYHGESRTRGWEATRSRARGG